MPSRTFLRVSVPAGEVLLEGKWEPDPNVEAEVIARVGAYLRDYQPPLRSAQGIAIQDTKKRFTYEIDPDDHPWQELSPSYLAWKEGRGFAPDILQLTSQAGNSGSLSYTAPTGWEVIGNTLIYDADVLPGYGLKHQEGRGGKNPLPKRKFIGLSAEAVEEIALAFEIWADGVGHVFEEPISSDYEFGSNVLGTFPIISHYRGQPILRTSRGPRFGRKGF